MGIDLRKTSHVLFFIVFLPGVSFGAGWGFAQLFPDLPFWAEGLSPLAAYGLLYGFFERFAWHWPIFRWLGVVTMPDVRGRWLGEQISSYRDGNNKPRISRTVMEVKQTFSSIKATTYYKNWQTAHCVSSFIPVDGECVLFIMFESEPRPGYDGVVAPHKGVTRLLRQPDATLKGTYFNANGNHGELLFKRTSFVLHQTFDAVTSK